MDFLEFAKEIALYAGSVMLKYIDTDKDASYKEDETIVTRADKEINDYLIERVKSVYPNHAVDGEEAQFGESEYVWVCDPVDGTAMYARGIRTATFSLALTLNGETIVAVVNDVFSNKLYYAEKGNGSYCNGKRINVNEFNLKDKQSIGHFDMWPSAPYNIYDVVKELGKSSYILSIGSVVRACLEVANGGFTFAIFPGTLHKNCDIAAVNLIVTEAGGIVTDMFGNEQRYDQSINGAIISNKVVYSEVLETIKKYVDSL